VLTGPCWLDKPQPVKRDGAIIRGPDLETVADAASRMGVSPSWVYQLINRNLLDYYEVAGRKLVHRRDINNMIQQRAS
jgi:excisionase family DNA binding protein